MIDQNDTRRGSGQRVSIRPSRKANERRLMASRSATLGP
ncbi:hypothetical protein A7982_13022 [Minicystis rosea]|nr:hypothetical protein A7982_13022 [Minicystis rosea]